MLDINYITFIAWTIFLVTWGVTTIAIHFLLTLISFLSVGPIFSLPECLIFTPRYPVFWLDHS